MDALGGSSRTSEGRTLAASYLFKGLQEYLDASVDVLAVLLQCKVDDFCAHDRSSSTSLHLIITDVIDDLNALHRSTSG